LISFFATHFSNHLQTVPCHTNANFTFLFKQHTTTHCNTLQHT